MGLSLVHREILWVAFRALGQIEVEVMYTNRSHLPNAADRVPHKTMLADPTNYKPFGVQKLICVRSFPIEPHARKSQHHGRRRERMNI
jgi:hypothetical protein